MDRETENARADIVMRQRARQNGHVPMPRNTGELVNFIRAVIADDAALAAIDEQEQHDQIIDSIHDTYGKG